MTDTDGVFLASHTPGTGGAYAVYPGYSNAGQIRSNRATGSGTASYGGYTNAAAPATPDYDVGADFVALSLAENDTAALMGRADHTAASGSDTYYFLTYLLATTEWNLSKAVAGVFTTLGTFTQTLTVSQTYAVVLRMRGTSIKAVVDGADVISVADSGIAAANRGGFYMRWGGPGADIHIDNHFVRSDSSLPPPPRPSALLRM